MAEAEEEFVCSYRHAGHTYGINIHARDFKDASARLRAIGTTGSVDGTLVAKIYLTPSAGFRRRFKAAIAILFGRVTP